MRKLRMPPRIKVLEAAGALADGRVSVESLLPLARARVSSSDGSRVYDVAVATVGTRVFRAYSSDNGTLLRGYVGYPIIAVLMEEGVLPRDPVVEEALRGVPWRRLNEELKRYALVLERVLAAAEERGVPRGRILAYMDRVYGLLRGLTVYLDSSLARREASQ